MVGGRGLMFAGSGHLGNKGLGAAVPADRHWLDDQVGAVDAEDLEAVALDLQIIADGKARPVGVFGLQLRSVWVKVSCFWVH